MQYGSFDDLASAILVSAYFDQEQFKKYGNWRDIPEETAFRLMRNLRDSIVKHTKE